MIDRDMVERALRLADEAQAAGVSTSISISYDGEIIVLLHNHKAALDVALRHVPRLKRKEFRSGNIWGVGDYDGIRVHVADIAKCQVVYEEVETPEMAPTGKMVKKTVMRYHCPDGDILAPKMG